MGCVSPHDLTLYHPVFLVSVVPSPSKPRHSSIVIAMLAPHGVGNTLLNRIGLGQVSHQSFLAVLMRGVALGNNSEAVAQDQLVYSRSE